MADVIELDGPALGPANGGEARKLVVLLHGYGADGNDLAGLAPYFAQVLPDALFVSPNAPHPCEMGFGYQWFSIQNPDPALRMEQIGEAEAILNAFIDRQLADLGLSDDRLALVGFSQGTMMSLYTAPRRAAPCACIMGYSGRLEGGDRLPDEIRSRPPVTLVHGDQDPLLPVEMMEYAAETLRANGIDVETHLRPGLGHGIDEEGLRIGMAFLAKVFRR